MCTGVGREKWILSEMVGVQVQDSLLPGHGFLPDTITQRCSKAIICPCPSRPSPYSLIRPLCCPTPLHLCSSEIQRGLGFPQACSGILHFLFISCFLSVPPPCPQFLTKPRYTGALSALYRVATEEGLRGMYSGLIPSLVGVGHVIIQVC